MVIAEDRIYVIGGWIGNDPSAATEVLASGASSWTAGPSLLTTRYWHSSTVVYGVRAAAEMHARCHRQC